MAEVFREDDAATVAYELLDVLSLTRVADDRFKGETPDWFDQPRLFGGAVVALALSAAVQTVDEATPVHSLHGYFLRPVRPGPPVDLSVESLRDGRSFRTRQVEMRQDGRPVFSMTASFHADEPGDEYQLTMPRDVPPPQSLPGSDWDRPFDAREGGETPPEGDGTYRSTGRRWFRWPEGVLVPPRLQAPLTAFLSDMTGSSFRPHSLGTWGEHTDASLDHALWFHRPLPFEDWVLFDLQAVVNAGGRSTVRGVLFAADGSLCASMAQELLIRPLEPDAPAAPDPPHA